MHKVGVTAVLNVQTDLDILHRQINWTNIQKTYKKLNIELIRQPIRDFDKDDLIQKLKGASDLLEKLISKKKVVYVHCTAGMSRAAATVIAYLVFYDSYSVEEAFDYVKSYRDIICPNMKAINEVDKRELSIE